MHLEESVFLLPLLIENHILIEKGITTVKRAIFSVLILLSGSYFQFRHFLRIETCTFLVFEIPELKFRFFAFKPTPPLGIFPKFLRIFSNVSPNEVLGCRYSLISDAKKKQLLSFSRGLALSVTTEVKEDDLG